MDWNTRTVLVTGAGGFIGSHLTERLVDLGANTRAFLRYSSGGSRGWLARSPAAQHVEFFLGDIRDRDVLAQAMRGVDVVFHLAALIGIPYSYLAPSSYVRTNVEGTLNVLELAKGASLERVVHTSTSEVYGTAQTVPIAETHPLRGQSPYSASKIGADKMAEAYHLSFGLPVATVRPFNTYGPRQSTRAVIPTIITQALEGREVRLGNLTPTRDLTFVEDTVEGFLRAAEAPGAVGQVTNLGTGREVSIGDLARKIIELVGAEVAVTADDLRLRPEQSEVQRLVSDTSRASAVLGWEARHTLEAGLQKTIQWFREHRDLYTSADTYGV